MTLLDRLKPEYKEILDRKNNDKGYGFITPIGETKEIFFIDSKKYTIYKSHIRETDWLLLKIIN